MKELEVFQKDWRKRKVKLRDKWQGSPFVFCNKLGDHTSIRPLQQPGESFSKEMDLRIFGYTTFAILLLLFLSRQVWILKLFRSVLGIPNTRQQQIIMRTSPRKSLERQSLNWTSLILENDQFDFHPQFTPNWRSPDFTHINLMGTKRKNLVAPRFSEAFEWSG